MAEKFTDKFVKPFSEPNAKALTVLTNIAKNPMSFVALGSMIGSALTLVGLGDASVSSSFLGNAESVIHHIG